MATLSHLDRFNETIGKWIGYLDDYSLEMLRRKPENTTWSLGQVYVHIIDDTKYFVEQMKTSLLSNANGEKAMHADARSMFASDGFPDAMLEGPSTNSAMRQPESKEELLQNLLAIKNEVNTLYAAFDFPGSAGKTEHPGLLFFNALEWLQFAEMHLRHHFRQKSRIDNRLR